MWIWSRRGADQWPHPQGRLYSSCQTRPQPDLGVRRLEQWCSWSGLQIQSLALISASIPYFELCAGPTASGGRSSRRWQLLGRLREMQYGQPAHCQGGACWAAVESLLSGRWMEDKQNWCCSVEYIAIRTDWGLSWKYHLQTTPCSRCAVTPLDWQRWGFCKGPPFNCSEQGNQWTPGGWWSPSMFAQEEERWLHALHAVCCVPLFLSLAGGQARQLSQWPTTPIRW